LDAELHPWLRWALCSFRSFTCSTSLRRPQQPSKPLSCFRRALTGSRAPAATARQDGGHSLLVLAILRYAALDINVSSGPCPIALKLAIVGRRHFWRAFVSNNSWGLDMAQISAQVQNSTGGNAIVIVADLFGSQSRQVDGSPFALADNEISAQFLLNVGNDGLATINWSVPRGPSGTVDRVVVGTVVQIR
jgi:hypothetical protein